MNFNKNQLLSSIENKESSILHQYLNTCDKKKPLGKMTPTYWQIELTRGCNLRCSCCPTRLFSDEGYKFMDIDTWKSTIQLIKTFTPYCRVDFALAGEPTLNPNILEILKIGREISPNTFFHIVTNGTLLLKGQLFYKDLFDAGANLILVDMYSPKEIHYKLAEESGYTWYNKDDKSMKQGIPAWNYNKDINIKQIVFQNNPYNWGSNRNRKGVLSNFLNNLDWEVATKEFGITPVIKAPDRRCQQPFRAVNVSYDGYYSFCCLDFMREIYGKIGNVKENEEGFINFWFGKYMQNTRKLLFNKNRNDHHLCKKCDYIFSRCDIPVWCDDVLDYYYENNIWRSK
jgi:organic radical activating enzyme